MPQRSIQKSKPADLNQLARAIVDEATDEPSQKELTFGYADVWTWTAICAD
jgi:hypothetical protein